MFWDATYYGGHTGTAVEAPRTRWHFAEGSQGFFDTYVLLANANAHDRRPPPCRSSSRAPPASCRRYPVAADVADQRLRRRDPGARQQVVLDRRDVDAADHRRAGDVLRHSASSKAGTSRRASRGRHDVVPRRGRDRLVLRHLRPGRQSQRHAGQRDADVPARATARALVRNKVVPANSRLTLYVDGEAPALADAAVSTTVVSDVPVIAERAMYWPGRRPTGARRTTASA